MPKTRLRGCEGRYGRIPKAQSTGLWFVTNKPQISNKRKENRNYGDCNYKNKRERDKYSPRKISETHIMAFFQSSIGALQTVVVALGAGLGVWGGINLLEGYGNDNPGAKSQGMKQLMAGGGVALIGTTLVPLLAGLF